MIVKDIFSDTIPALSKMDSAQRALYFMDFFKVSHLPIVEDNIYVGMLTDELVLDIQKESFPVSECELLRLNTYVYINQHIYDVILQMSQNKLSLVAVVDQEGHYLGTINMMELIVAVGKITSLDQTGSIVVLKMGIRDYSLSEIAQITEENQVKILSSYIQTCQDQLNIRVTLKLNTSDLASIKTSFERYNYEIEFIFSENQVVDDMYKGRLDELMHFLNI